MKMFSFDKPNKFIKFNYMGKTFYDVNFDIIEEIKDGVQGFSFRNLRLNIFNFNYDNIVSEIITQEYPNDKMTAIINNFLLDPSNREEFDEMQKFRKFAKAWAKEILTYPNSNN